MDKSDPRQQPTDEELDDLNEHWHDPGDPDGVFEAEQQRKWQEEHRASSATTPGAYRRKRRWPAVLLVVVLIAAAAGGAYWFGARKASAPAPTTKPKQTTSQTTTSPAKDVPTKHYDSATYTLGFDYPETWKVADTTTKLTVTSPSMQLTTAAGKQVSGHVVVTMRNKQAVLAEFASGPATAALESQKLTYKQPTAIQRAQTYLSFLAYGSTQGSGVDALYITGDSGYQAEQTIPMADVVKGDPLVSVTFVSCASEDCATGTVTPLTLASSAWKDTVLNKPIIALLESITLS